jgi:hypothetical protein
MTIATDLATPFGEEAPGSSEGARRAYPHHRGHANPPSPPTSDDRGLADFIDPPQTTDSLVETSYVHRANQVRGSPAAAAALRMFRQGYEFLEDLVGRPRLGLNFVSFQRDLAVVHHVLHPPGWLGDVKFGGRTFGLNSSGYLSRWPEVS